MNRVKIEIYNEELDKYQDYSPHVAMPFKVSELLDEQLDEAELQLQFVSQSIFEPLTKVKVTIINETNNKISSNDFNALFTNSDFEQSDYITTFENNKAIVKKEILMLVANDKATERPIGSGKYNHVLYLIEFTKFLEGFVGDSLTFTNPLGSVFGNVDAIFSVNDEAYTSNEATSLYRQGYNTDEKINLYTNVEGFFQSLGYGISEEDLNIGAGLYVRTVSGNNIYKQYIDGDDEFGIALFEKVRDLPTVRLSPVSPGSSGGYKVDWVPAQIIIDTPGKYTFSYRTATENPNYPIVTASSIINIIENRLPLKKWSASDVICRILETVEHLRGFNVGASFPRFKLQGVRYVKAASGKITRSYIEGSLADRLDKILAPEFSFTKMTLREMLQQVGGFIHGEPRIKGLVRDMIANYDGPITTYQEVDFYEIVFDEYGKTDKTYLANANKPYISKEESIAINDYCTALDSSADNLISSLNYAQGVVVEPFYGQFKTLRTVNASIKFEENDNTVIETTKPIYEMGLREQLICKLGTKEYDITPYVYAQADYNNLSSYEGSYPYVKAYALYYVPGEKNIRGLFFKNESAGSGYWKKYAISNILNAVSGLDIDFSIVNLNLLQFQVKYIPYNNERIKTTKPIIRQGLPRTMVYNQSANGVETRYLGENLKGLITRLGNVEKSVTYLFSNITEIPKVGLKYDNTYYISAVTTEILPTCFKCTLALSKHFNRQSQYVGLNSEKRMWEVSERQISERESVITDYVKIYEVAESEVSSATNDADVLLNSTVQPYIMKELLNLAANRTQNSTRKPISAATIKTFSKSGIETYEGYVILPTTSTAYGNSLVFSLDFLDNYSAGTNIYESAVNYGNYVPYSDYYGRFYSMYLAFSDGQGAISIDPSNLPYSTVDIPNPLFVAGSTSDNKANTALCYQKDNREVPAISYELQFVSDGSVIIGSTLGSNCRLVNYNPSKLMFILLDKEISLLEGKNFSEGHRVGIPLSGSQYGAEMLPLEDGLLVIDSDTGNNYLELRDYTSANHKAWAIITEPTTTEITVVDEDGDPITQTIYEGGELVLGQNKPSQGQCIAFQMKSDIYKKF